MQERRNKANVITTAELYVSTEIREKLFDAYSREQQLNGLNLGEEDTQAKLSDTQHQLDLIEQARNKITKMDESVGTKKQTKQQLENYDRIGQMAKLLRNKTSMWGAVEALDAVTTGMSIYYASNYQSFSTDERRKFEDAMQVMSGKDKNGNTVAGLYTDTLFYQFSPSKESLQGNRIEEYTNDLLEGGHRKISSESNINDNSLRAKPNQPNSYYQPRFFPDNNGKSETDKIVLHAGGMEKHTATRILQKEADPNKPGGYRYIYTKINAGAGGEELNQANTVTYYPIFSSEIVPAYKKVNGKFEELSDLEKADLKAQADPKKYQLAMRDTLEALIDAERRIELHSPSSISNDHGETKSNDQSKTARWEELNERINIARGGRVQIAKGQDGQEIRSVIVPEIQKISLPIQRTGNCTVYSTALCFGALMGAEKHDNPNNVIDRAGINIGMDFIQQAKTYTHHNVLNSLEITESKLNREKNWLSQGSYVASMTVYDSDIRRIMDAAQKGREYEGQDPILYAIDKGIKFNNMHPIEWAIAYNNNVRFDRDDLKVKIDGKYPTTWALENRDQSKMNGQDFLDYLQDFRLQSKKNMISDLALDGKNILVTLLDEYSMEKTKNSPNQDKLINLEKLYKDIANTLRPKLELMDKNSGFGKMLNSTSAKKVAESLHSIDLSLENKVAHITESNSKSAPLLECCTLDVAYRAMKVGKEIEKFETQHDTVVKKVLGDIKDFFRGKKNMHEDVVKEGISNLKKTLNFQEENPKKANGESNNKANLQKQNLEEMKVESRKKANTESSELSSKLPPSKEKSNAWVEKVGNHAQQQGNSNIR